MGDGALVCTRLQEASLYISLSTISSVWQLRCILALFLLPQIEGLSRLGNVFTNAGNSFGERFFNGKHGRIYWSLP
jgi:hypothetical protein